MTQHPTWNQLWAFCRFTLCKDESVLQYIPQTEKIDWEELLRLARRHRVRPLLYRALLAWEGETPDEIKEKLKTVTQRTALENLNFTRELLRFIPLFRAEGVEIVPYKGSLLAQQAYGEIGIRETSDIDFLFQIEDFSKIRKVLESQKYQAEIEVPAYFEKHFFRQDCEFNFDFYKNGRRIFHIEPHWYIGYQMRQININQEQLADFITEQKWFGTRIQCFTPEGLLLTTCMHHGGKDAWLILKHLCDTTAILQQFGQTIDWSFLLKKAKELQVEHLLLLGVGLAVHFFQIELPNIIQKRIESRKIQKLIQASTQRISSNTPLLTLETKAFFQHLYFQLQIRKHWSTKFKILFFHIWRIFEPNINDVLAQEKHRPYWQLFLLKPFRMLRK